MFVGLMGFKAPNFKITNVHIKCISGNVTTPMREIMLRVKIADKSFITNFLILNETVSSPSLTGHLFLKAICLCIDQMNDLKYDYCLSSWLKDTNCKIQKLMN